MGRQSARIVRRVAKTSLVVWTLLVLVVMCGMNPHGKERDRLLTERGGKLTDADYAYLQGHAQGQIVVNALVWMVGGVPLLIAFGLARRAERRSGPDEMD